MFKKFDGANEKLIKEFEEEIKFELPIDYSEFLLETNGGTFDNFENGFMIESNNEEIQMDSLFGFKDERSLNLINWYKEYKLELPENTLIIGNTYGAGLILLIWKNDIKGVYLWGDSLELENSTEDSCTYKIADSFNDFIDMIKI